MIATESLTRTEVSCRNDARAGVGDRVVVLEWSDPVRGTRGRVAVPAGSEDVHATLLAGPSASTRVLPVGVGTVGRVIQWLKLGRDTSGTRIAARVVVTLDQPSASQPVRQYHDEESHRHRPDDALHQGQYTHVRRG